MTYTYGSYVPDFSVYPDAPRRNRQSVGAIALGALFLALIVGCIWAVIDTGQWLMLLALPILGLALFGLWKSMEGRGWRNKADPSKPVIVLNGAGIGDGSAQIPWSNVAAVDVFVHYFRQGGQRSLGRTLAMGFSDMAGVLDGTVRLSVYIRDTRQLGDASAKLPNLQGNVAIFDIGAVVPAAQWPQIVEAIRQNVRARGIATQR